MKKILSIIACLFCLISFNTCFQANYVLAEDTYVQEAALEPVPKELVGDDALNEPIFPEAKQKSEKKEAASKISSIIIKIVAGLILSVVVILCLSFIWLAKIQRENKSKRKKQSTNENVINAIDDFARHRIK